MNSSSAPEKGYDYTFKIVLIGDSGVGKSSIILNYTSDNKGDHLPSPTVGVDFKTKILTLGDKKVKITIWDTAGQERFRTLTSSFYRGAHGILMVYDVTRKDTFTSLANKWIEELKLYSAYHDSVKVLVGNKLDLESSRMVTREEGIAFANQHGFLFYESSAKTGENVAKCFEGLLLKVLGVMDEPANVMKMLHDMQGIPGPPVFVPSSGAGCCG
ncbi:ras-related protein RABC1-like isoform X1 [Zingiber officinale]|uniref:ras-related protein RABC1-like isoform X1 n=1 Tax=Zingiber officinale TaxID=94328 RepID=UPI001C4D794B|nr:ras-related protein RABC1-like isoform X1 [Zingiber officinale]